MARVDPRVLFMYRHHLGLRGIQVPLDHMAVADDEAQRVHGVPVARQDHVVPAVRVVVLPAGDSPFEDGESTDCHHIVCHPKMKRRN